MLLELGQWLSKGCHGNAHRRKQDDTENMALVVGNRERVRIPGI